MITDHLGKAAGPPTAGERWFRRGLDFCRVGRYNEALDPLEKAMACAVEEKNAPYQLKLRSFYGLAMVLARGDIARGRRLCEEAIADAPLDADLYANLGLVYLKIRRRGLAVEAFNTALSIDPNHAGAVANLTRMGRRKRPVFPFLSRRHPLNKLAGQMRHRWQVKRRNPGR